MAAVPLTCRKRIFGALTVYSTYPDAFDGEEVELLQILARSLAHACYALETEEKHKKAEKALKKSEEHYRTLVEALGEGIVVTDLDENIEYVNPALCFLLGYRKSELIGRNLKDFIPPSQWPIVKEHSRLRLEGKSSCYELQIITRFGDDKIVRVTGVPVRDEVGKNHKNAGCLKRYNPVEGIGEGTPQTGQGRRADGSL